MITAQHAEIDNFQRELLAGSPSAVVNYFTLVVEASDYPEGFPQHAKIAYVPESKQLVIEYDLPLFDVIPEVSLYKYAKTKDEVTETARPLAQRKALYSSVVAQITLRTLYELFKADRIGHVDIIVFNGYVTSIDKGTGRPVRTCLITVRTNRDIFMQLDLSKVDPLACLNVLNASVSKSPTELAPVRPVGGVDCVAFDPRPIFGGKVVIQAKRYKNTVGVSAVRDLYGTMQNEGASKGDFGHNQRLRKSLFRVC